MHTCIKSNIPRRRILRFRPPAGIELYRLSSNRRNLHRHLHLRIREEQRVLRRGPIIMFPGSWRNYRLL